MADLDYGGAAGGQEAPKSTRAVDLRDAFYALGLITLVVAVLTLASDLLATIAIAVLLWFLVNSVAHFLQRAPVFKSIIPEWLALTLAAILTLGLMGLAGQVVVSNLAQLSDNFQNLDARLAATLTRLEQTIGMPIDYDLSRLTSAVSIESVLGRIASAIGGAASSFSLILLFVLFLLIDQRYYDAKIRALFPESSRQSRVRLVLRKIGEDTRLYIWLMTAVSVVVGLATFALASYFDIEGAAFWGFLAFALNYIPTIGSFLGVIFPGAFAFVQIDEIEKTVFFIVLLGLVQFVAGNLVLPKLMGERLNLSQFVVILSLSVWGAMWGVAGLFLAVPLMMILNIVLSQFQSTRPVAILMSRNGVV